MNECAVYQVETTVESLADGERLARSLVGARLAACVQLDPGLTSVFRWEGQVQTEPEIRLTMKTSGTRLEELCEAIETQHPYDVPQVLAVAIAYASPAYAEWVRSETTVDADR
ncbi:Divalent-cation tolerance protein CutA [Roseimaritima multifibrata]|uniref:Divalent-cation tolerance protein CutA n=1 Tax=Roseimaritima multifibrata TaxID=1930274 RepID=A0A517MCG9_9BACT|nr:divalent-cation tolerance protein CutA [Roseimaritima multifibrata]QDS92588.1 Divalent-cation tolerance protein CutA [Roseimaritima multifibrata]